MTYEPRATEYLYRDHWVRLEAGLWTVRDERDGEPLWQSESIDDCMSTIDNVMDEVDG